MDSTQKAATRIRVRGRAIYPSRRIRDEYKGWTGCRCPRMFPEATIFFRAVEQQPKYYYFKSSTSTGYVKLQCLVPTTTVADAHPKNLQKRGPQVLVIDLC